jgi:hypothetical protein
MSEKSIFVREFEEQILSLEKKVEALQNDVQKLTKDHESTRQAFASMMVLSQLQSTVGFAMAMSSSVNAAQALENVSSFAKEAKGWLDMGFLPENSHVAIRALTSSIIAYARMKGITFDAVATVLIRELGEAHAKQLVDVTALVQLYGIGYANEWKKMLGIS